MRLTCVLVALAVTLSHPLTAQQPSDTTPPPSRTRFYFAGGVELVRFLPNAYGESFSPALGLSLQAGAARQFGRVGLRLGLAYSERERQHGPYSFGGFSEPFSVSDTRAIAVNADLTYDLTRSRIRPYLVGGLSMYRASVSHHYSDGTTARDTRYGVALVPGVGLRIPLRNAEAFTEARFHLFSGDSHVVLPLTFGIRF
jgi:opacity protein-like surface antigen